MEGPFDRLTAVSCSSHPCMKTMRAIPSSNKLRQIDSGTKAARGAGHATGGFSSSTVNFQTKEKDGMGFLSSR